MVDTPTADNPREPDISHVNPAAQATWFGHPRQLARLFTTEMWERFGYYGMRALLALYLAQWFLFDDATTGGLYGAFTSLVYLTPLFGGLIADRILGSKRSVKMGAIIMCLGYLGLCFGGEQARPVFIHNGQTYEVQSATDAATGRSVQSVVTSAGAYAIRGNEDGSVTLEGSDGSVLPQTIARGEFRADGQRDPFWISVMLFSLSLVVVGNGFFKPNISTMVGSLYEQGDRRRDAGFTIFYMGINLGSIGSQILAPLFAQWFGWWAGFALVSAGMLIAWTLFQFDGGRLKGYGEPPADVGEKTRLYVYAGVILAIPVAWFLLNNAMLSAQAAHAAASDGSGIIGYFAALPLLGKVLFALFLVAVIGIPIWAARVGTKQEFQMMVVAIILVIMSVVFWTLFELAGSALTLFAERSTDRNLLGWNMPAGSVQAFNPIFIVMMAPFFAGLWVRLARRNVEPSIPVKFAIALVLVGLGFLIVVFGAGFADSQFRVGIIWLMLLYLVHSIGELCLSPVGLSMITKLSIARIVGLMMGVWFLATSMANYVGGMITQFASVETVGGEVTNPALALQTYVDTFWTIGIAAIVIGVFLFVISPLLKRWMHGVV